MVFFSIPDTEKFLKLVEKSRGDVMLHLPDGEQIDLKRNYVAKRIFSVMRPNQTGLRIGLSDAADTQAFIRYMMENRADQQTH